MCMGRSRRLALSLGVLVILALIAACAGPGELPAPEEQALLVRQGLDVLSNGADEYSYPYGVVIDGEGGQCSEEVVFSICNLGELDLSVFGVQLSSGDTEDFDLDCSGLPGAVPGRHAGDFSICFDPIATMGPRAAEVSISTNDPDEPVFTFAVKGYGVRRITAEDGSASDGFGRSVFLDGDTAIVGAGGAAYVFYRNHGGPENWGQVKKLAGGSGFGETVAVGGDAAMVGGETNSNRAYLFYRDVGGADNWGSDVIDSIYGGNLSDFGYSISVESDTMVVGAPLAVNGFAQGFARVFYREPGNIWGLMKELTSSDSGVQHYFGWTVALSGDTIMVGQNSIYASSREVFFYYRDQGGTNQWGEAKKITVASARAIALSGDVAVVGVEGAQAVNILERNTGGPDNWGLVKTIVSDELSFGRSVALSGDTLAVASHFHGEDGYYPGAVHVFGRNQGGSDNWGLVKRLFRQESGSQGDFGASLALHGDTVMIGTPWYDPDGGSGSVYIWEP